MKTIKRFSCILFLFLLIIQISCKSDNQAKNSNIESSVKTGDKELDMISDQIAKNGLDPKLRFERAQVLYNKEMYSEAIEDMRVAITIDSLVPEYYHFLSDIFMDSNNSSKSLQTMKVAQNLFPERIPTLLKLAETHYIIEQYAQSISVLNEVLRFDGQNAEAYFMLGVNFRDEGDEARALSALQTATEFDSKLTDAWLVLGDILDKKGNDKALNYYETASKIDPNNINALHSLAFYKQNHRDIEGALEIYRQINIVDKNYSDAYLNAGILYLEKKDLKSALEQFDIYVSQKPLSPVAHFYKGNTLSLMGDIKNARLSIQNALNLDPDYEKAIVLMKKLKE